VLKWDGMTKKSSDLASRNLSEGASAVQSSNRRDAIKSIAKFGAVAGASALTVGALDRTLLLPTIASSSAGPTFDENLYTLYPQGAGFKALASSESGLNSIPIQDTAQALFTAVLTNMTNGGPVGMKPGIYSNLANIAIPANLSFEFRGCGVPTIHYDPPGHLTGLVTPADGTQLRGAPSLNSAGGIQSIFTKESGTRSGFLTFRNLALMPAWGKTSNRVFLYSDYSTNGVWSLNIDNVLALPWGWYEDGIPMPANDGSNAFVDFYGPAGGNGSSFNVTTLIMEGMVGSESVQLGPQVDYVRIGHLKLYSCWSGLGFSASGGAVIDSVGMVNCGTQCAGFFQHGNSQTTILNRIGKIFVEGPTVSSEFIVYLDNPNTRLRIEDVYYWSSSQVSASVTNNDPVQLLYPCYVWGGYPSGTMTVLGTMQVGSAFSNPPSTIGPLIKQPGTNQVALAFQYSSASTWGGIGQDAKSNIGVFYDGNEIQALSSTQLQMLAPLGIGPNAYLPQNQLWTAVPSGATSSTPIYIGNATINTTLPSDRRLKKKIRSSRVRALDRIKQLRVVDYEYREDKVSLKGQQTGLVAQELEKIFPEYVTTDKISGIKRIEYHRMVPVLIKAIQELGEDFECL
jgi:Chaperone of endosialidase